MKILFLLALALLSCSKKNEIPSSEAIQSGERRIPVGSPKEAEEMAAEAFLGCLNPEDCALSVGMILSKTRSEIITCTAFLVGEDLVATNSHCISFEHKNGKSCGDSIEVLLPVHTKGKRRYPCKEIVSFSERPNALSPDLAILRIDAPAQQNPLVLSKKGFSETLLAIKVNPLEGASGIIVREQCVPAPYSYRFPLFREAQSPVGLLGECQSLPGNSGSPLLNAEGKVSAILQAYVPVSLSQRKIWRPFMAPQEKFAPLVLATNLNCLVSLPWKWNNDCTPTEEESIVRPRISDYSFPDHWPALSSDFEWKKNRLVEKSLERLVEWEPTCIKNATQSGFVVLPHYWERIEFNRYLQFKLAIKMGPEKKRRFDLPGNLPLCKASN